MLGMFQLLEIGSMYTLSSILGPVFQKIENVALQIHRYSETIHVSVNKIYGTIHRIELYLVDRIIHP